MNYSKIKIEEISNELVSVVDAAYNQLMAVDDSEASVKPAPGKWSKKEIIGHLLDSASNNHQRFVRAPQTDVLDFPGYAQDNWVDLQNYNAREWTELLDFWRSYNHHIAHVSCQIPESQLETECRVGSYDPSSLGYLVDDYLVHMKHHLKTLL